MEYRVESARGDLESNMGLKGSGEISKITKRNRLT